MAVVPPVRDPERERGRDHQHHQPHHQKSTAPAVTGVAIQRGGVELVAAAAAPSGPAGIESGRAVAVGGGEACIGYCKSARRRI